MIANGADQTLAEALFVEYKSCSPSASVHTANEFPTGVIPRTRFDPLSNIESSVKNVGVVGLVLDQVEVLRALTVDCPVSTHIVCEAAPPVAPKVPCSSTLYSAVPP
jgi:hypothetical protein